MAGNPEYAEAIENLMCGRFTLFVTPEEIANVFSVSHSEAGRLLGGGPRYNVAPTTEVATVRQGKGGDGRVLSMLRWGLVPHWAKGPGAGPLMINARAETIAEKPAFRSSFRSRRCLVIANGFYEWKKSPEGKQPHYFQVDDGALFAFAGIWDAWSGREKEECESCAIVTTAANELTKPVHDRMPVILDRSSWDIWLRCGREDSPPLENLQSLLQPFPGERMSVYTVSSIVNNPRNDVPDCVEPYSLDA